MERSKLIGILAILVLFAGLSLVPQYQDFGLIARAATANIPAEVDAYVLNKYPNNNYGSVNGLHCNPKSGALRRVWIRFDLSGLPAGATIISATLKLYYYRFGGSNPAGRTIECYHCIDDSWIEGGINWNNAPNAQCAGTLTDSATVPGSYEWMQWDVTADVQSDLGGDGKSTFRLMDSSEGTGSSFAVKFRSQEYTTSSLRPVLEVEYTEKSFSISLSPTTTSLANKVSEETTITVTVTQHGGWTGAVDLDVSGLPTGVSEVFTDDPVTLSGASVQTTLTLHVDSETTPGTYTVTVSGSGAGGKSGQASLTLTITPVVYGNYPFEVKAGASKIVVTCTWSGTGSLEITLIEPGGSPQHLETGLSMYERTTINVDNGATVYHNLKRVELTTPTSGTWTLKLTISGVTTYQADIEVI